MGTLEMGTESRIGWWYSLLAGLSICIAGCSAVAGLSSKEDKTPSPPVAEPEYVGDFVHTDGLAPVLVDSVGLVLNLPGTGSDPPPSEMRAELQHEMSVHKANEPNRLLASENTAMVIVRGIIPAGARKGDHFDLEVYVAPRTTTTSLRSGWLMETVLKEHISVGQELHSGDRIAHGGGNVLIQSSLEKEDDDSRETRGIVLGGGIVERDRPLGLQVRPEFVTHTISRAVADAINRRFHIYHRGTKQGASEAKRDRFIQLRVHPQYYDNVIRYVRVIQNIPVDPHDKRIVERLETLRLQMQRPETAVKAAIRLEALGEEGIPVLKEMLSSESPELRFYAAESLAYQDVKEGAEPLVEIAKSQPAFRLRALVALGSMRKIAGQEGLIQLLDEESAETRFGAFRVLRKSLPKHDPIVAERLMDADFHLHVVPSLSTPLVHVATHELPEIVIFGADVKVKSPLLAFAGSGISVRSDEAGSVTVKRLSDDDDPDEVITTTDDLANVIQAISSIGASYPDVVQFLGEIKEDHSLAARLEFSAIPELNRTFERDRDSVGGTAESELAPYQDLGLEGDSDLEPPTGGSFDGVSKGGVEFELDSAAAGDTKATEPTAPKIDLPSIDSEITPTADSEPLPPGNGGRKPSTRPPTEFELETQEAVEIARQMNAEMDAILQRK